MLPAVFFFMPVQILLKWHNIFASLAHDEINKPSLTLFKGRVTDVNGKIAIFAPYNLRRSNFYRNK